MLLKAYKRRCYGLLTLFLLPLTSQAQQSLDNTFRKIAAGIKGTVGVSAEVLETGEKASLNPRMQFPMQSVYKFPISMAVLHAVDKGKFTLQQPVKVLPADLIPKEGHSPLRDKYPAANIDLSIAELLRYNMSESDGTACDVLLRILGGTAAADKYVRSLGIKDIRIATTEQVQVPNDLIQYRNWSTPTAMTALLKKFYNGHVLSDSSYAYLLDIMVKSTPGSRRLKAQLPKGTVVAHKTGTANTYNGLTRATNDAGIITLPNGHHLVITVFVKDAQATQEEREGIIAQMAKAAWDHWVH